MLQQMPQSQTEQQYLPAYDATYRPSKKRIVVVARKKKDERCHAKRGERSTSMANKAVTVAEPVIGDNDIY